LVGAWVEEYHECSEDVRHYTNLSWQIPSAVLLVDFVVLGLALSNTQILTSRVRILILLLGFAYSFILTLNFAKLAYRATKRRELLERIERAHRRILFGRYSYKEHWLIRKANLRHFMALLLASVSIGMLILSLRIARII
jgi:hypothetical protein